MEHNEAVQIIIKKFEVEKGKKILTYKELSDALGMKPKEAKKHLFQMVNDGMLVQHNAGTIYYERKTTA